jgi:glycosyltransferase involved in cell wall biosynthesis
MRSDQPLVIVLTPVYNGGRFLCDCIDSVLAQDYDNWQYVIVNNCSTDDTLEIAQKYAAQDKRIRVSTNSSFLSMPQNFNRAFSMVPPESSYFKVVCADDWLYARCLSTMVRFAEEHPTAGVVSCYQRSGEQIRWASLPKEVCVLKGSDACRKVLLEGAAIFPAPTAALYRTRLLSDGRPFFPNDSPHSDTSACYEHLDRCDLGVVHEILAVERVHETQITAQISPVAAGDLAYIEGVIEYGPKYLTASELNARRREVLRHYYRGLGRALLKRREVAFWKFQRDRLAELGLTLDPLQIGRGVLAILASHLVRPLDAWRKASAAVHYRLGR